MVNEAHIITLEKFHETKLKEKNSLFVTQSFPIENEDDFQKIITEIKKKYYDATHHCFAYKLQNNQIKYSDDGEPNGTAGIRILNAIDHFKLKNTLVVVIRYFGGTKLGVGLLGKSYYESAIQNLSGAQIIKKLAYLKLTITVDFEFLSFVHRNLSLIDAKIESTNYGSKVEFICFIKPADVENLKQQLIDLTHGTVLIEDNNDHIFLL